MRHPFDLKVLLNPPWNLDHFVGLNSLYKEALVPGALVPPCWASEPIIPVWLGQDPRISQWEHLICLPGQVTTVLTMTIFSFPEPIISNLSPDQSPGLSTFYTHPRLSSPYLCPPKYPVLYRESRSVHCMASMPAACRTSPTREIKTVWLVFFSPDPACSLPWDQL